MSESIGQQFARTFDIQDPTKGSTAEPESKKRYKDLLLQKRINPSKPATVINLHPFPLTLNDPMLKGMQIPACPPGQVEGVKFVIRSWRLDYGNTQENGSMIPGAIEPIQQAAQFLREFKHLGGIVIYEGEANPNKVGDVVEFTDEGEPVFTFFEDEQGKYEAPVRRPFTEVFERAKQIRDAFYHGQVQGAVSEWNSPNGANRKNVTDMHRMMAEVLYAEGKLAQKPNFTIETREQAGLSETICPSCQVRPNAGAIVCGNCNYIFLPLKAYELSMIEYGNLAMDRMAPEEWDVANELHEKRQAARQGTKGKGKAKPATT